MGCFLDEVKSCWKGKSLNIWLTHVSGFHLNVSHHIWSRIKIRVELMQFDEAKTLLWGGPGAHLVTRAAHVLRLNNHYTITICLLLQLFTFNPLSITLEKGSVLLWFLWSQIELCAFSIQYRRGTYGWERGGQLAEDNCFLQCANCSESHLRRHTHTPKC